jgi:hypothetical protein
MRCAHDSAAHGWGSSLPLCLKARTINRISELRTGSPLLVR